MDAGLLCAALIMTTYVIAQALLVYAHADTNTGPTVGYSRREALSG